MDQDAGRRARAKVPLEEASMRFADALDVRCVRERERPQGQVPDAGTKHLEGTIS